tara:strand:- start:2936 stop:4138 length:1203 start_codon:yes stop_codon:yes gene_type:complete
MFTKKKIKNRSQHVQRKTMDTTHLSKLDTFEKMQEDEAKTNNEKEHLQNELNSLEGRSRRELSDDELNHLFALRKKLSTLERSAKNNANIQKTDYFLETGHLLFNYYGNKESDIKDIPKNAKNGSTQNNTDDIKNVLDFFSNESKSPVTQSSTNTNDNLNMSQIIDEYMEKVDNAHYKTILDPHTEFCVKCQSHKIFIETESTLLCTKCGEQEYILMNQSKPSYKDPPREYTFFAYKRINHFNEWLSQFQAKESTHIPDQIIIDLKKEIQKERITNIDAIDTKCARRFLKKLGYNKYYEHIPHIINKLNGIPPPIITPDTEEKLRSMFKMIQVPFLKHCPPKRKNFLSYSYVLHKFVELLGMFDLKSCFSLLKSRQKLYQQDKIWKEICKELKWTFIKSL